MIVRRYRRTFKAVSLFYVIKYPILWKGVQMMIGPFKAFKLRKDWAIDAELNQQICGYYNQLLLINVRLNTTVREIILIFDLIY